MNAFRYTARTEGGLKISGVMEADTEAAVLRMLEEKRLFPISVAGQGGAGARTPGGTTPRPRRRVKSRDVGDRKSVV